ncbi:Aste57867_17654 [Aphanomyces stellatus]|uniref:Aste57867_17654 protein n=1 Tax=Aphanomyces stellatus TaxID=120398 RepID=A0A485L8F2_9STRA|nr:hypothetical protein As57867_017593 [Aphanomyces stellatus]VFT94405.1 Aste57867_17654 [Aphanomyces stellatus]
MDQSEAASSKQDWDEARFILQADLRSPSNMMHLADEPESPLHRIGMPQASSTFDDRDADDANMSLLTLSKRTSFFTTLRKKHIWRRVSYCIGVGEHRPFTIPGTGQLVPRTKRNVAFFASLYTVALSLMGIGIVLLEFPLWVVWFCTRYALPRSCRHIDP